MLHIMSIFASSGGWWLLGDGILGWTGRGGWWGAFGVGVGCGVGCGFEGAIEGRLEPATVRGFLERFTGAGLAVFRFERTVLTEVMIDGLVLHWGWPYDINTKLLTSLLEWSTLTPTANQANFYSYLSSSCPWFSFSYLYLDDTPQKYPQHDPYTNCQYRIPHSG